jgi:hypothetical protein
MSLFKYMFVFFLFFGSLVKPARTNFLYLSSSTVVSHNHSQTVKGVEFYFRFRDELNFVILRSLNWITEGKIPMERIGIAKDGIRSNYLKCLMILFLVKDLRNMVI